MSIIESLTSLLAPDDCLACGREGALLCGRCLPCLPPLPGRCFGCYRPLPTGVACPGCLSVTDLGAVYAVASYEGVAKALVGRLKFHGSQSAVRPMVAAMLAGLQLPPAALLVHIPATTAHIRQRGYDQAELLSRLIARRTGCHRASPLARLGSHHQLGAGREQRLAQLSQALRVTHPAAVHGRHIVLIDDVLTTGATLRAAGAILHQAGASRVDALVFAQA